LIRRLEQSPDRDSILGRTYEGVGHAPRVELRVNGTKLQEDFAALVTQVEVAMSVDAADAVTLTVQGGRRLRESGGALVGDEHVFAEGNKLEILIGYENEALVSMGRFDLQVPKPSGGPEGRSLEVFGLGGAHKLLSNKQPWRFGKDVSDKEVIEQIGLLHGLDVDVIGPILPRTKQRKKDAGRTDFEFLDQIATEARNPRGLEFRWFVRFIDGIDVLTFEPFRVDLQDEQYVFRYEDDATGMSTLYQWEIDPGLKGMPTKVSIVYMNRKDREEREVVVNLADPTSDPEVLWSGKVGGLKGIDSEVRDGGAVRLRTGDELDDRNAITGPFPRLEFDSEDEAQHFALQWFRRRQFAFAAGRFGTVGMTNVRPWDVHWFKGMATRWDGQYVVTEVNHQLGRGTPYALDIVANRLPDEKLAPTTEVR